jgi:DNA-binding LacI/PurR family transcriptional regulator
MKKKSSNPTIYDIAKALRISSSTVSRALNGNSRISQDTIRKVKQKALELGYAQSVSSSIREDILGKSIGILVPALDSTKYSILVESCRKVMEEAGYHVLICCSSGQVGQEVKVLSLFDNLNVEGVVMSLASSRNEIEHVKSFAARRPLVLFDKVSFDIPSKRLMIDHFQAGFRAVQHFLNIGCSEIAHFGGHISCQLTRQVSSGYKTGLRNAGIKVNPALELFSDFLFEDVIRGVEILFNQDKVPDAILVDDILAAQKMVSVLNTRKVKIPDEVAIIALGDEKDYSYFSPSITTIQMPYKQLGVSSANALVDALSDGKMVTDDETAVESFNMIIRNSTLKR